MSPQGGHRIGLKIDKSTTTLLRGLLLPHETARGSLEEWCQQTDLDAVDSATHQLLPLLYRRLAHLDMAPQEMDRLRGVYRKTWYRNQRQLAVLRQAAEVLSEINVEVTLVGDLSLALGAYSELGSRMVDATQIVLPPESFEPSISRLLGSRFVVSGRTRIEGFGLPTRLTDQVGRQIEVREFLYGPGWPGEIDERLWGRREIAQLDGTPIRTLARTDAAAAAAAFGLTNPLLKYQCLVDMAMLSQQADPAVEWTKLIEDYQDTVVLVPIGEALRTIAVQIPGALNPAISNLAKQIRPSTKQQALFWFHRRGRRLARLPAWYRRAETKRVGFIPFAKNVYNVNNTQEAIARARRRFRSS